MYYTAAAAVCAGRAHNITYILRVSIIILTGTTRRRSPNGRPGLCVQKNKKRLRCPSHEIPTTTAAAAVVL